MMRAGISRKRICEALGLSYNTLDCWARRGRKRGDTAWRRGHVVDKLALVSEAVAERAEAERLTDEQRLVLLFFATVPETRRKQLLEYFPALCAEDHFEKANRRRKLGKLEQTPIRLSLEEPSTLLSDEAVDFLLQILKGSDRLFQEIQLILRNDHLWSLVCQQRAGV